MTHPLKLQDIGEQGLLARIQRFCPDGVIGDDAALLQPSSGHFLVVTTDMLVDGVHFSVGLETPGLITTAPADAGWRSAAANLSDLAAMGATPLGITVSLGLPGATPVEWVEQLYQGLVDCLSPFRTPIVGGDVCQSPVLTVAIAAFGEVQPQWAIRRALAQPGDAILVTGVHGASRAGLELLLHPEQGQGVSAGDRAALIQAHQRPHPRLDVIPRLHQCYDQYDDWGDAPERNDPAYRIAGMDSSDGLADAVVQICRASGVGARLERQLIPRPPQVEGWLSEEQALQWALYGGEDFELVLCLPEAIAHQLTADLGPGAAIIGQIVAAESVVLYDRTGQCPEQCLSLSQGFQHFQPPTPA